MQISLRLHKHNSAIFQFYVAFHLTVVQHLSDKFLPRKEITSERTESFLTKWN